MLPPHTEWGNMLTSIAAIAGAISALIGVGWGIFAAIKQARHDRWENEGRSLEQQILEASTDEERVKLAKLYAEHLSK